MITEQEVIYRNPYVGIEYSSFINRFVVRLTDKPVRQLCRTFATVEEAMAARDFYLEQVATNPNYLEPETPQIEEMN